MTRRVSRVRESLTPISVLVDTNYEDAVQAVASLKAQHPRRSSGGAGS